MKLLLVLTGLLTFSALAFVSPTHQKDCFQDPETLSTFIPQENFPDKTKGLLIISEQIDKETILSVIEAKVTNEKLKEFKSIQCPKIDLKAYQ